MWSRYKKKKKNEQNVNYQRIPYTICWPTRPAHVAYSWQVISDKCAFLLAALIPYVTATCPAVSTDGQHPRGHERVGQMQHRPTWGGGVRSKES